jgi:hypothetical protein
LLLFLNGAFVLVRQRLILGSEPQKCGNRIDIADRFREASENLCLSAKVGSTIYSNRSGGVRPKLALTGCSPDHKGEDHQAGDQ